jgi:adenylylsulfate kinase-like enzyme
VDAGLVPHFTGRESVFEPPAHPHLILNTETTPLEHSLETLYSFLLGQITIAA